MSIQPKPLAQFACVIAIACAPTASSAGDLNPPFGPVAPTMKDLETVEPRIAINATNTPGDADSIFRITEPGSYYLTDNVKGDIGKRGIEISLPSGGPGVSIDLRGFEVAGVPGSLQGIYVESTDTHNIAIHNGTVREWGNHGIDLTQSENNLVTNMRLHFNGQHGLVAGRITSVIDCTAQSNGADGFSLSFGCSARDCTSRSNAGRGLFAGGGSQVSRCTVTLNGTDGMQIASGSISNCTAESNGNIGLRVGSTGVVTDCYSRFSGGDGIFTGFSSVITGCTAEQNSGDGIETGSASTISGCNANDNNGDGIRVPSNCRVAGNQCVANGSGLSAGSAIHATGSDNRIESNSALSSDIGFDIDGAGNILIGNTASNNTVNWDVVNGNFALVILATSGGAFAGNSGGASLGSTNPFANFTY